MRPGLFLTRDDATVLLVALGIALALAFSIVGAMAARRALLDLPADFLVNDMPRAATPWRAFLRFVVGALLVVAGIGMLVLPGPGILLIALGALTWSPRVRRHVLAAALTRPRALRALNGFRRRHGRQALALG